VGRRAMLTLELVHAGYGSAEVLFGVSLQVREGEVVALSGRNGMGKTTTLRSVLGILRPSHGEIRFRGVRLVGLKPHEIVGMGIAYVPEGRQIFAGLSVLENLLVAQAPRGKQRVWEVEKIFDLFPVLKVRQKNAGLSLSGGEQQMLAIGRALMSQPNLLILDEATEGLAPLVREQIWRVLKVLKSMGQAILVVDKHLHAVARLADMHYVIEKGHVVWSGTSERMLGDPVAQQSLLGV
jgi:branched-chain amino acid transport system ATP-binding protein